MKVSERYKRLYHYTTWGGLVGIIENRCLWATHHRFLNDYSETLLLKDKLIELAKPIVQEESRKFVDGHPDQRRIMKIIETSSGFDAVVDHNTDVLVRGMYATVPSDGPYITSFCGESKDEYINANGMLSQWRGYGQDGGFALVFDTQRMGCMLVKEYERLAYSHIELDRVVYSNDEERFKEEFEPRLSNLRGFIEGMIRCIHEGALDPMVQNHENAFRDFASCMSRYKHRGFKEENEVRICAFPAIRDEKDGLDKDQLKPEKERTFRTKNGEQVPYIELFNTLDQDLPIERIIVGPHQNKEARVSALRVMLHGTSIKVSDSDIPFIG